MYPHALLFIQDLAIIMLVAGVITVLFHRLKQPVVLGYIIAGVIIGRYTPPFSYIHDENTIKTLAELGVIFLMFSLGLEFDLHRLKKVGLPSAVAALSEIVVMMWVGYQIGLMFHWSAIDSLFLGAILAISSTTIIIKALEELGMKRERFAQYVFGILIIEDIFAIAILALLSTISMSGSLQYQTILFTSIKLMSFLVFSLVLGILFVPKILSYIAKFNNNEMLLISVLGFCFGFCLLVVKLDYSIALGAFVIGAIIAESRQLKLIEQLILPLRDMFSAIFFVSVGLMFDPKILVEYAWPITVITLAVVIGKVLVCSFSTFLTGRNKKTSMRVGMSLAQIGEFSFIIATMGITLNVTSYFLFPLAVAVSAITTFLTPYLIKYSDPTTKFINRIMPQSLTNILELYTAWIRNIKPSEERAEIVKMRRRGLFQVLINLFIVIAVFLGGAYFATTDLGEVLVNLTNERIQKTLIWAAALLLSLPFLIAIYGRIKTFSVLLAQLNVRKRVTQRFNLRVRKVISEVIPIVSLIGILLLVSVLSLTILPPIEFLVGISLGTLALVIFLYSWFTKLHNRLQDELVKSIKKENPDENNPQ